MLRHTLPLALALSLLACPSNEPTQTPETKPETTPEPAPSEPPPGHVVGSIALPGGQSLDFAIALQVDAGKVAAAKLWIPMQGVAAVDFDEVRHEGAPIELTWKAVGAQWILEFGAEPSCTFSQRGLALECDVEPVAEQAFAELLAPKRPQTPVAPFPYTVELVKFANAAAPEVTLGGSLTIPEGPGPHPAVVLITGSGQQDRDETIFGHKPFAVLADYLSRRGIAVLRYDDRGFGESTGDYGKATMVDFAGDAWAAVEFLRTRPEIDRKRIGLIGHSEGGVVGPAVAAAHAKDIAFVVMLAGTGVNGQQVIRHQLGLIMQASGAKEEDVTRERDYADRMHAALVASEPGQARAALEPILKEWYEGLDSTEKLGVGDFDRALTDRVAALDTPWMRHFLAYDPAPTLAKLKMPVLAINGENDLQVDPDQNLPPIEKALKKNKRATIVRLPGLNHLFQPGTGSPNEYGTIETTMDPAALEQVATWVRKQTKLE
ncbi:alpha/beta hydrolase family protein [Nannocystaceae bacterium ST9]